MRNSAVNAPSVAALVAFRHHPILKPLLLAGNLKNSPSVSSCTKASTAGAMRRSG
ncbi:MAG: hypothetical protein NTX04_05290 [Verrucomicrobia bacterium]|nr:hypothetical protein [Verrucomicrobiota bacterium]